MQVMLDGHDPALEEKVLKSAEVTEQLLKEHKGWTFKWNLAPQVVLNPGACSAMDSCPHRAGFGLQVSSEWCRLSAPRVTTSCTLQVNVGQIGVQLGSIGMERVAPPAEWGHLAAVGARVMVEYCQKDKQAKLGLSRCRSATVATGNWDRRQSLSIGEVVFSSEVCRNPETKVLKLVLQPNATFLRLKDPKNARLLSTSDDTSQYTYFPAFEVSVTLKPSRHAAVAAAISRLA